MFGKIRTGFSSWLRNEDGVATAEAGLVFPVLLTLLLGTFDMGNAILSNQKTIRASQIVADLITRERMVSTHDINEAIDAGELAFAPLNSDSYGVDIVSIRFDEDSEAEIVWRETRNMAPATDVLTRVEELASPLSGVVVVFIQYEFEPIFAGFVVGDIPMQEVAFAKGRQSSVVNKET